MKYGIIMSIKNLKKKYLRNHRLKNSKLLPLAGKLQRFYRKIKGTLVRSKAIKSYLISHQNRRLQIGAGSNILKDWLNTDLNPKSHIVYLDATKPFPFEDKTFDYIFSEHQIEHLTYGDARFMLRECYRVLKPGGKIRIDTPDLEVLIDLFATNKSELQQRFIRWVVDNYLPEHGIYNECFVINNYYRKEWVHQFIYDLKTFKNVLKEVGFIKINRYSSGESDDEILRGIDTHHKNMDSEDWEMSKFETMAFEAKRPK